MNMIALSGHEAVASLVLLQRSLYESMASRHPFEDHEHLTDAPRFGSITTSDAYWEFTRHGRGFRFEAVPGGPVVDILVYMPSEREFFDALRLAEYMESIGVTELRFADAVVDATSERAIERQFIYMVQTGLLVKHPHGKHLYRLAS